MHERLSGRVLVVGDVHQEHEALERALCWASERNIRSVLCCGDLVDGHGDLQRCVELLQAANAQVVRGNHERWALEGSMRALPQAAAAAEVSAVREYLAALPPTRSYQTPLGRLLLCHGLGEDDMSMLTPDDYGYALEVNDSLKRLLSTPGLCLVVAGHSHRRMVRRLGQLLFINAGTLARDDAPCFVELNFDEQAVRFVNLDGSEQTVAMASP